MQTSAMGRKQTLQYVCNRPEADGRELGNLRVLKLT